MENVLFTIGYASKEIGEFIYLLKKHGITCLIDVRSTPFSKTFPNYDKNKLKDILKNEGILYAHFGDEFGARRNEAELYTKIYTLRGERKEQVDFDKVYKSQNFQIGVNRIFKALEQGFRICFMCSEKQPVDCHRFWMVAYYFATLEKPFEIINIISNNETKTFDDVLNEVELDKEKTKFYNNHYENLGFSLIEIQTPAWVTYWDELFTNIKEEHNLKHKFSNIRIGYTKEGGNNG